MYILTGDFVTWPSLNYFFFSQIGGISKQYSEDLQCLIKSMLSRTSDLRPSTSQILHGQFVKGHISSFLRDTKQPEKEPEQSNEGRQEDCNVQINPRRLENQSVNVKNFVKDTSGMHPEGKFSRGKNQEDGNMEKQRDALRPNLNAKRCCEIFPEFESLHISGDKMKLEDRSRLESKPSGVKECHCKRQGNEELLAAGHGSRSRRRRHTSKRTANQGSILNLGELNPSEAELCTHEDDLLSPISIESGMPIPLSYSARERRRQRRIQEKNQELETKIVNRTPSTLDGEYDTKEISDQDAVDGHTSSDVYSRMSTENNLTRQIGTAKLQEVKDFVNILDTTLHNDCAENQTETSEEDKPQAGPSNGLQSRISLLEETLINKVGKVRE